MSPLFWIIATALFLFLLQRYLIGHMYNLKLTPHTDTPEKFGLDYEELRFPTKNQRTLYGWWIPADDQPEKAPTLILVHGWSRNLGRMLRYIQHLHPLNYNLLAFDARHHGSSDPDHHSSMYKFGQDIQSAVQYARTRSIDPEKIGVIGLSIGGAGSVYAAAIEPGIKAVVTVGAPAHPVDIMRTQFRKYHVPSPLIWLILKQVESVIGISYDEFAPVNNIAKATAAFLVIHGEKDEVIPLSHGEKLKQAARSDQCEFWRLPERRHSDCHHEAGFWDRVHVFFQKNLNKD